MKTKDYQAPQAEEIQLSNPASVLKQLSLESVVSFEDLENQEDWYLTN